MTHREFKLTVRKEIVEHIGGLEVTPVIYKPGDVVIVDEATFLQLQSGTLIKRWSRIGSVSFDKYDFENEVAVTEVTVEYTTRKLGQRKNKVA